MPPFSDKKRMENSLQLCFERLGCPATFQAKSSVLTAFATGQQTALVIDSGHATTSVTAVHEGYALTKACIWNVKAGHHLSLELLRTLQASSQPLRPRYSFTRRRLADGKAEMVVQQYPNTHPTYARWALVELMEGIKESCFYLPPAEVNSSVVTPQPYTLPDGTSVSLGPERLHIPGLMFADGAGPALQDMVAQCVQKCDQDIRPLLCRATVLAGGNTLIDGFVPRFETEVTARLPGIAKARPPIAMPGAAERKNAAWFGGSILASLGTFQQLWISRAEYQESGAGIVHRKCP
eukprot:EG_transcript_9320